jgi:hypothetical protein
LLGVVGVLVTTIDRSSIPVLLCGAIGLPGAMAWVAGCAWLGLRSTLNDEINQLCRRAGVSRRDLLALAALDPRLGANKGFLRFIGRGQDADRGPREGEAPAEAR